jgi:hypothetical protein
MSNKRNKNELRYLLRQRSGAEDCSVDDIAALFYLFACDGTIVICIQSGDIIIASLSTDGSSDIYVREITVDDSGKIKTDCYYMDSRNFRSDFFGISSTSFKFYLEKLPTIVKKRYCKSIRKHYSKAIKA